MRRARWLAEWRKSAEKPVFYHVISRVVDRRFVLGAEEKEKFRALMRIYEKFSGCRVTDGPAVTKRSSPPPARWEKNRPRA